MEPSEIERLAEACYSRGGLAGFQEGNIRVDGERFTLSPAEAASIERAICRVHTEESLLIETSFPTNSVPVGLAVALAYSEHPQMGGTNSPVLLFPRQGYTTVFDRFHYRDAADWNAQPNSQPIPRRPVDSLSTIESKWGVCTANSQFRFDFDEWSALPTAIIIDLRAPRWNDTYAYQLVKLFAAANKGRIVFVGDSDGEGTGYRLARTHSDEQLRIGPEHLESSPINEIPIELDTQLAIVEETLATHDVTYDYYSIVDPKADNLHRRLAAKKIELQERDIAPAAVGGLYNRLTQLPTKPKYWNRVSDAHGYFDSVPQQIDYLKLTSERTGRGTSRIQNYIETAREVEATLNEQHKLQNYLLNALERADEAEGEIKFIFSNERVQEAFVLAAEENSISAGADTGVTLTTRSNAEPSQDARTVYAGAAPHESTHYEFPLSKTVAFVTFAILGPFVSSRGRSLAGNTVTHTEHTVGEGGEDPEPLDIEEIEGDVTQAVGPAASESATAANGSGLMDGTSLWGAKDPQSTEAEEEEDDTSNRSTARSHTGPTTQLQVSFEESHEPIELSPLSRVTKYYPDKGDIDRTRAKSLERGDTIILLDHIPDDIYDIVVDNASEIESVREDVDLIEGWRDQLNHTLDDENWTVKEFQEQLAEMGSNITSPVTVTLWRYGTTIAPEDPDDIKRVYQLCRPGIDASMFDTLADEVHRAAERLRERHQKIGKRIRSLIEYELDATTSSSQPEHYDEATRRRIREDTKRLTVAEIESETITPTGQEESPASEPAND